MDTQKEIQSIQRDNKLLELMNTMQDNISTLATRLVELEERVGKNESK